MIWLWVYKGNDFAAKTVVANGKMRQAVINNDADLSTKRLYCDARMHARRAPMATFAAYFLIFI